MIRFLENRHVNSTKALTFGLILALLLLPATDALRAMNAKTPYSSTSGRNSVEPLEHGRFQ